VPLLSHTNTSPTFAVLNLLRYYGTLRKAPDALLKIWCYCGQSLSLALPLLVVLAGHMQLTKGSLNFSAIPDFVLCSIVMTIFRKILQTISFLSRRG
jgi:hypothetical protein